MSDSGREWARTPDNAFKRKRILRGLEQHSHIVTDNDGYKLFWPSQLGCGLDAFALRVIADELDRLNRDWDEQVKRDVPLLADGMMPDQCPSTGERNCGMCSGEYCVRHGVRPCECGVVERHTKENVAGDPD